MLFRSGDFKGAGNKAAEATGIPAVARTVKAAAKGDAEAIGSLAAVVTVGIITHKAGGAKSGGGKATISEIAESSGSSLSNEANVVRGGTNSAAQFENGSGVNISSNGTLNNVSVNSANGMTVSELSQGIKNGQVGHTTVGEIRTFCGEVTPSPTRNNPNHSTLSGITAEQAHELFTPTISNPSKGL